MGTTDPTDLTDSQVYAHLVRIIRADSPEHLHDNAAAWLAASQALHAQAATFRREATVVEGSWRDATGRAIVAKVNAHATALEKEAGTYQNNYEKITNAGHALTEVQAKLDRVSTDASLSPAQKAQAATELVVALDGDYQTSHHGLTDPSNRADAYDNIRVTDDGDTNQAPQDGTPPASSRAPSSPQAGTPTPAPLTQPGPSGVTPNPGAPVSPAPVPQEPSSPPRSVPGEEPPPSTGGLAGAGRSPLIGVDPVGTGPSWPDRPTTLGNTGLVSSPLGGPGGSGIGAPSDWRTASAVTPGLGDSRSSSGRGFGPATRSTSTGIGSGTNTARPGSSGQPAPGAPTGGAGRSEGRRDLRSRMYKTGESPFALHPSEQGPPGVIGARRRKDEPEEPGARLWDQDDDSFAPNADGADPDLLGISAPPVRADADEYDDWWGQDGYADPEPDEPEPEVAVAPPTAREVQQLQSLGINLATGNRA